MRTIRIRLTVVILALLMTAGIVRGDAAPAFLKSSDERFPEMRFDNLADYPEYDFYLLYYHSRGNPSPHVMRIQSGEVIRHFEGNGRNGGAYLLAVAQGKSLPPRVEHYGKPEGYLRSAPLDGAHRNPDTLFTYRVQIIDGQLIVVMQSSEAQWGARLLRWLEALPCVLVPLALCVLAGWLGVRVARRVFPPKPAGPMGTP